MTVVYRVSVSYPNARREFGAPDFASEEEAVDWLKSLTIEGVEFEILKVYCK